MIINKKGFEKIFMNKKIFKNIFINEETQIDSHEKKRFPQMITNKKYECMQINSR